MNNTEFILKFFERLFDERSELQRKITELNFFIKVSPRYKELNDFQKSALVKKLKIMGEYRDILKAQINNIEEEYDIKTND